MPPFETSTQATRRTLLGQVYTPQPVADLLVALTVRGEHPQILDPACGTGVLLDRVRDARPDLHANLWGCELDTDAAAVAARTHRVIVGDFFACTPGETVERADGPMPLPMFDCIVANPPYVRSQQQDDHDPAARARLFAAARQAGVAADAKTDLFAFFLYHALQFLKFGGRLGFITPASWLTADYAAALQTLLLGELRLHAIVGSSAEALFPQADVNAVLLIAERTDRCTDRPLRFVTLRRPLAGQSAATLAAQILADDGPHEHQNLRVRTVSARDERAHLAAAPTTPRNWSRHLRTPLACDDLWNNPAFTRLDAVARVSLGYKSLQNDFYYVDRETIDAYAIEPWFLEPITMLADLDGRRVHQTPEPVRWIFVCKQPEHELAGTGALRYIHARAGLPAARRKQSLAASTIRDVLQAQGGGLWYAPKARPRPAHVWLRKAVHAIHAPFVLEPAGVVDQRCNAVEPLDGSSWLPLAAALTTTVFALALEVHGSVSLGAGALEAATGKLRAYPVLDLRRLDADARTTLVGLARAAWREPAVDWTAPMVGPALRALDAWVLARAGLAALQDRIHTDLHELCRTRVRVGRGLV